MPARNGQQYIQGLRERPPSLYMNGEKVQDNPWQGTTLEWATSSPPLGHGNFPGPVAVYRGPYEYSVPKAKSDFSPQFVKKA